MQVRSYVGTGCLAETGATRGKGEAAMAKSESLDNVLRAAFNSVLEAQQLAQEQHLRQLNHYFKDGKPAVTELDIGEAEPVTIPQIALVQPSAMRIDTLQMKFSLGLKGFQRASRSVEGFTANESDKLKKHAGPLQCDFLADASHGNTVQIEMNFEKSTPPEAYMRIVDKVLNTD